MPRERWRPVPGYEEFYEVSDQGRVRRACLLGQWLGRGGYPVVRLTVGGKTKTVYVHALVAAAFIGPRPTPKHEVNHKDKDRWNARLRKLEYVTRSENIKHALANGARRLRGIEKPHHKLTEADVVAILQATETDREVARRFGVHHSTIGRIRRGEDWPHITGRRRRKERAA